VSRSRSNRFSANGFHCFLHHCSNVAHRSLRICLFRSSCVLLQAMWAGWRTQRVTLAAEGRVSFLYRGMCKLVCDCRRFRIKHVRPNIRFASVRMKSCEYSALACPRQFAGLLFEFLSAFGRNTAFWSKHRALSFTSTFLPSTPLG